MAEQEQKNNHQESSAAIHMDLLREEIRPEGGRAAIPATKLTNEIMETFKKIQEIDEAIILVEKMRLSYEHFLVKFHQHSQNQNVNNFHLYEEAIQFQNDLTEFWEQLHKPSQTFLQCRQRDRTRNSLHLPSDEKKFADIQNMYSEIEKFIQMHQHNLDVKEAMDYLEFLANSQSVSFSPFQAREAVNERNKPRDWKETPFDGPVEVLTFLKTKIKTFDEKFKLFFVKKKHPMELSEDDQFIKLLKKTGQVDASAMPEADDELLFLQDFEAPKEEGPGLPLIAKYKHPEGKCPENPYLERSPASSLDGSHLIVVCKGVFQAHFRLSPASNYRVKFFSIHPDLPARDYNQGLSGLNEASEMEALPFRDDFDQERYYELEPEELPASNEFRKISLLGTYTKNLYNQAIEHNLCPLVEWTIRYRDLFRQKCSICKKLWAYEMSVIEEGETSADFPTYNGYTDVRAGLALKHMSCLHLRAMGEVGSQT